VDFVVGQRLSSPARAVRAADPLGIGGIVTWRLAGWLVELGGGR
jgi:hypothetical protein